MGFSLSSFLSNPFEAVSDTAESLGGAVQDAGHWANANLLQPAENLGSNVGDWATDMSRFGASWGQDTWDNISHNPLSAVFFDPVSAKLANKVLRRDSIRPSVSIYGGPTEQNFANAERRGIDTSNTRGVDTAGRAAADTVANYYTFGLGSTALHALDNYGNDRSNNGMLGQAAKNFAINYIAANGLEAAGAQLPTTGGVTDASGAVIRPEGFNLGKTLGAGDYAPVVNSAAKGAATAAFSEAAQGGNSREIGQAALRSGVTAGAQTGGGMLMDYFNAPGAQYQADGTPIPYGSSQAVEQQPSPVTEYFNSFTAPQAPQERGYGYTPADSRRQALDFNPVEAPPNAPPAGQASSPFAAFSNLGSTLTTPNGLWPGVTPANVGNWGQVGTGLYAMWKAKQMAKLGAPTGAQTAARGNMEALMRDPSSMVNMPGYKAGEQAVTRSMAANGYLGSGNMMAELQNYGGGFYNDTLRTMGGLAQPTPDQLQYNMGSTQLTGQGLQSLLYGGAGLLNPKKPGVK
mgnify:CR=1 FL=1|tara:strand:- start:1074 stop:2627 length:1554 start_codon:yes stop_codon:yes gene_type:complete